MFQFKSTVAAAFFATLLVPTQAVYYFTKTMVEAGYVCGTELCCGDTAPVFEVYGANVPGCRNECSCDLGKWEAKQSPLQWSGDNWSSCTYGDYKGLDNNWAYCDHGDGHGELWLNGQYRDCTYVGDQNIHFISCPQGFACYFRVVLQAVCYDETWRGGKRDVYTGPTNDDLAKILNIPVLEIEAAGINVTHHMINKRSIMPKDMALSAITTEQWAAAANLTVAEYNAYGPLNITRS